MNWWTLLLSVGTTARVTRLITHDTITAVLRRRLAVADARMRLRKALRTPQWLARPPAETGGPIVTPPADANRSTTVIDQPGPLYSFITCPWCVSVWAGFAAVAALVATHGQTHQCLTYAYAALTASYATGYAASRTH